jgi:hypothetical protein
MIESYISVPMMKLVTVLETWIDNKYPYIILLQRLPSKLMHYTEVAERIPIDGGDNDAQVSPLLMHIPPPHWSV